MLPTFQCFDFLRSKFYVNFCVISYHINTTLLRLCDSIDSVDKAFIEHTLTKNLFKLIFTVEHPDRSAIKTARQQFRDFLSMKIF